MWTYSFYNNIVDAVYAMAHALDRCIKEKCEGKEFRNCKKAQPAPMNAELLRSIRDVSFVGLQGTQVCIIQYKHVTTN